MTYRVRNIFIAVALALVAGLLSLFYVANYKRHVQHSEKTVPVYVATGDIAVGTSGADIVKRHLLATSQVAQRTVVPGAISNPDQLVNLVSTQPILAEEQVTLRRFADHAELGPRAQLHGTLRALAITGDPAQLLDGVLKAGDHVDLIASFDPKTGDTGTISRVILRNLLVLQASATTGTGGKVSGGSTGSVLMAVSEQRQLQKIFWVMKNADGWSFDLRPVTNATDSPEDVESAKSVAIDGITAANRDHMNNGSPK
jgi:Flp pilus assembly protein CpaB